MNYNDIRKAYSIWICMDMKECVYDHIHLTDTKTLGEHKWKGDLDIFNIIMIGLPKKLPEKDPKYELHRLLTALLSMELPADEKMAIVNEEYEISEDRIGEELNVMCNLSQGVLEKGIEQGIEQGMTLGYDKARSELIEKMYKQNIPVEQIAQVMEMSLEDLKKVIDQL